MDDDLAAGILDRDEQLVIDSIERAVRIADIEGVISHTSENGVGKARVSTWDIERVAAAAEVEKQLLDGCVVNNHIPRIQARDPQNVVDWTSVDLGGLGIIINK